MPQTPAELRRIFDRVPTFIWKYDPARGRAVYANQMIVELSGLSQDDFMLNSAEWLRRVDSGAESQEALRVWREAMARGEPFQIVFRFHTPHKGPRWFQSTGRPALEDGELYYYGNTTDVTEQKLTEQSHIQLASALEQADEALIITSLEGKIEYVNPAFERMTGYTREEALGKKPSMLKSGKQDEAFYHEVWQTISGGNPWRGRFINKKKDGSLYEQWATITPVRDDAGRLIHFVAVQLDMTYQLDLERQLRQAERLAAVGETISGLAHYIKNILSALKGSSYVMEEAIGKEEIDKIRAMWGIYSRNSQRLLDLTRQMLGYVSVRQPEIEAVCLNTLIGEVADSVKADAAAQGVGVQFAPARGLPLVPCDKTMIFDAVMNLAGNAIDACGGLSGSEVLIRAAVAPDGESVQVSVEDNGPGIPPECLPRIFDPFFSTKGSKGSGLGLAMVQKTIREHHGTVDVASAPGQTVFTIRLPM